MTIGRRTGVAVLAGAIVAVAASGVAAASGGKAVLLGHVNSAFGTTEIKSKNGSALILKSRLSSPPLVVSNKRQIPRLNASYLNGLTAKQIEAKAGGKNRITEVAAQMSGGVGIVLCPAGTAPIGGGVVPDPTGTSDTDVPFIVASSPHVTGDQVPVLDGWEGVASDFDGTYNGGGVVFVSCSAAVSQPSIRAAARLGATERHAEVTRR